jgi:hypothetical protein
LCDCVSSHCELTIAPISFLRRIRFAFVFSDPIKRFLVWTCDNGECVGPPLDSGKRSAIVSHCDSGVNQVRGFIVVIFNRSRKAYLTG